MGPHQPETSTDDFDVRVEQIDADRAVQLWNQARVASAFTHPLLLGALARDVRWWLALESGRPAWLWPACVNAAGDAAAPELCYYVGPIRIDEPDPSPRRRLLRDIAIQRHLLDVLSRAHGRLRWSTMPGENDLRPWLWYGVEGRRPVALPRYTAVIDGLAGTDEEGLLRRFSTTRRYEARAASAKDPVMLPPAGVERIKQLYQDTLAASGAADVAERRMGEVEALVEMASRGHGRVMTFGMGDDGVARAAWIVLVAKGRAFEALGASDHAWRGACLNAHGRLRCILAAQAMGAERYDFVGANSPRRGSDKHSYGAEAQLYFELQHGSG
jgi:hypothetical protein